MRLHVLACGPFLTPTAAIPHLLDHRPRTVLAFPSGRLERNRSVRMHALSPNLRTFLNGTKSSSEPRVAAYNCNSRVLETEAGRELVNEGQLGLYALALSK